ncbi:MAG: hypothetical protein ACEQSH_00270 [Bacteroidia bacterium]
MTDAMVERQRGAVEMLCAEIGEPFNMDLERPEMLLAFVRELVREISHMMELGAAISHVTGRNVSQDATAALAVAIEMVATQEVRQAIGRAVAIHNISHAAAEDVADRPLEMLSACASAVRFGLESPRCSRHAAAAAQQIWANKYGVSLFDRQTPNWERDWARGVFRDALAAVAVERWGALASAAEIQSLIGEK